MNNQTAALVLDVGTSSIKAFVFDQTYQCLAQSERKLSICHPKRAHVEQNPKELLRLSATVLKTAVRLSGIHPSRMVMGITNQRETTILWDAKTGKSVYPAIVWQDRRTEKQCYSLKRHASDVRSRTGLVLSSYFSASKIAWVLRNVPKAQTLIRQNRLLFGTVDSWLLWNFVEGRPHLTDFTNAARTLLFNIQTLFWDTKLLGIFGVPRELMPKVVPSQYEYGRVKKEILGYSIPLLAVCGDQQSGMAAAGSKKGTTKVTYGTGTFVMQSLGTIFAAQKNFFTTLIPNHGTPYYALEAKIDVGGKEVERALHSKKKLIAQLTRIACLVDKRLKELPLQPRVLVIDGGVTRDGLMKTIQEQVSGIPIQPLSTFHGTALGIAKLLLDR
ncbi:MAG: FGGY family carbohydrate kinase [Patescibacteria group bacterium]